MEELLKALWQIQEQFELQQQLNKLITDKIDELEKKIYDLENKINETNK